MTKPEHPKGTQAYVRARDARVEELYFSDGLEPREIAVQMLDEGTLKADTLDSAMRTVRGIVVPLKDRSNAARKDDAESPVATSETDAIERKLTRLRGDRDWNLMVAGGEADADGKDAIISTTTVTPDGAIVVQRLKWPATARVNARKEAARLTIKIAELEMLLVQKRDAIAEASERGESGGLTLIESDKSIPELIKANLIVGRFGKKGNDGSGGTTATA